ncbi:SDR family oxidoreductase [Crossiella sp. S99.1]|uniref:SDR family oxidoreductase n=1 Tax=Crossiella sp. S99.1 TaxID=2936271 RepID=UPI001FFF3508|nr:SDR family oxidoreductase [Crossiella sp. S99.1]MCK2251647.1 SDR family oxidoreductase [Crossiella sp. S99.1]
MLIEGEGAPVPPTRAQDQPTAVVTGASRGIGARIAAALGDSHRLVLGGRGSPALTRLARELPDAQAWPVNLADPRALHVPPGIERLDALIHNAGVLATGRIEECDGGLWRRTFEVNVFAVVELTRLLLPALRKAGGHVVLINSTAGLQANAARGAYSASKYALRAFADSLRAEEPRLRVTTVFLGRVATDMQRDVCAVEGLRYQPERYLSPATVAETVRAVLAAPREACATELVLRPGATRGSD